MAHHGAPWRLPRPERPWRRPTPNHPYDILDSHYNLFFTRIDEKTRKSSSVYPQVIFGTAAATGKAARSRQCDRSRARAKPHKDRRGPQGWLGAARQDGPPRNLVPPRGEGRLARNSSRRRRMERHRQGRERISALMPGCCQRTSKTPARRKLHALDNTASIAMRLGYWGRRQQINRERKSQSPAGSATTGGYGPSGAAHLNSRRPSTRRRRITCA